MSKIHKFRFHPHKILPLVFDQSLSYYEFLCKVLAKLNEVIDKFNNEFDAKLEEMQEIFEQKLEEWENAIEAIINSKITALKNELKAWLEELCEECKEEMQEWIESQLANYATKSWVNSQLANYATKDYVDDAVSDALGEAKSYTDSKVASCLASAKSYTDGKIADLKSYVDAQDQALKDYFNELISNRLFLYTTILGYNTVLTYNHTAKTVNINGSMAYVDSTDEHGLWRHAWNTTVDLSNPESQSGQPPVFYHLVIEMNPTTGQRVGLKAISEGQGELINFNKYRPILSYDLTSGTPIEVFVHLSNPDVNWVYI